MLASRSAEVDRLQRLCDPQVSLPPPRYISRDVLNAPSAASGGQRTRGRASSGGSSLKDKRHAYGANRRTFLSDLKPQSESTFDMARSDKRFWAARNGPNFASERRFGKGARR